jgi:hypothetical protein
MPEITDLLNLYQESMNEISIHRKVSAYKGQCTNREREQKETGTHVVARNE